MDELLEEVRRLASEALASFQERAGGKLDYSEPSLVVVEEMLAEAAQWAGGMEPEHVRAIVERFGCYILETARTEFGGSYSWHRDRDQPVLVVGEPDFHVALVAWDKVRGRLSGDSAENIPFFYRGFAERVSAREPGAHVLIT